MLDELVEGAMDMLDEPNLGNRMNMVPVIHSGHPLGGLLLAAPSAEYALRATARFQRVMTTFERARITDEGATLLCTLRLPDESRPAARQLREAMISNCVRMLRLVSGEHIAPLSVTFRHREPVDVTPLAEVLDCPLYFGSPTTTIRYAISDLRSRAALASPVFLGLFERQLEAQLEEVPATYSVRTQVLQLLEQRLGTGQTQLEDVASGLRMSARTLQRRLGAEGSSHAEVLSELRSERARVLLDAGEEIGEVAFQLGYSTPSAFHRAFRRWYDCTPEEWRARGARS